MAGFFGQLRVREEAKDAKPIIRLDHDDAFLGQVLTVIAGLAVGACDKSATVVPHDDRQPGACGFGWNPDVEIQAVFTRLAVAKVDVPEYIGLQAGWAKLVGWPDAGPVGWGP